MNHRRVTGGLLTVAGLAGLALYLAPYVNGPSHLPPLAAEKVLRRAQAALQRDSFSETLSYQNNVWPTELDVARLIDFPLPGGNVRTIVLFQADPQNWRFEEMNSVNNVVGVVARSGEQLTAYDSSNNHRIVTRLSGGLGRSWTVWQLPSLSTEDKKWTVTSAPGRLAGLPAYRVILRPKQSNTLWGRMTYWFSGETFLPLAFSITDAHAQTVLDLKVKSLKLGLPGTAAAPPTAGRRVRWQASPVWARALGRLVVTWLAPFPAQLGPLTRVSTHHALNSALAVYGNGPGEVVVIETSVHALKSHAGSDLLHPVGSSRRFNGVTDGIVSVVTFRDKDCEVVLMGSRSQRELAGWARHAWR